MEVGVLQLFGRTIRLRQPVGNDAVERYATCLLVPDPVARWISEILVSRTYALHGFKSVQFCGPKISLANTEIRFCAPLSPHLCSHPREGPRRLRSKWTVRLEKP